MCKTSTITLETIPVKIVKIEKIISTLNNSFPVNGDPFLTELIIKPGIPIFNKIFDAYTFTSSLKMFFLAPTKPTIIINNKIVICVTIVVIFIIILFP